MAAHDTKEKRGERLQLMLTAEEISAVDEWRFDNRMPSRSAAVRALMKLGFDASAPLAENAEDVMGVSSGDIGVLDVDDRLEEALSGRMSGQVLIAGNDLFAAHAARSIVIDVAPHVIGPVTTGDELRDLAGRSDVAAVVLVLSGEDVGGLMKAASRAGPPVICCMDDDAAQAQSRINGAKVISQLSAPDLLVSALNDVIGDHGGADADG